MSASIGILNVGAGDTKLTFDPKNPAECIRSARIVTDMLKRGYALLVEVERNGRKVYERVLEFREDKYEYVIADFDPLIAATVDSQETASEEISDKAQPALKPAAPRGRKTARRAIPATGATGVAVARSAGG